MTTGAVSPKLNFMGILKGMTYFAAAGASVTGAFAGERMVITAQIQTLPQPDALYQMPAAALDFGASIKEMVDGGLPVSTVADLMNVERKTVYAWMKGAQPRQEAVARLADLFPVLHDRFGASWKTAHRLWRTKASDGSTLGEILSARQVDLGGLQRHLDALAPAIRRHVAQDSASWKSGRAGNAAIDDATVALFGDV